MGLDAIYRAFVAAQPRATLWHDADFLEGFGADANGAVWKYAAVHEGDALVAVLPYYSRKQLTMRIVEMPILLRYCGPLINDDWAQRVGKAACLQRILEAIPSSIAAFHQAWPADWFADQPLEALLQAEEELIPSEYSFGTRPTYLVPLSGSLEDVQQLANKTMRKRLRRGEEYWTLGLGDLADRALDLIEAPLIRQGLSIPYRREMMVDIFRKLKARGLAASHEALDEFGNPQAVSIVLADSKKAYCWVSGSSDEARTNDGGSYVLAKDIAWAHARGLELVDFLGSALPGPAENRRQLGGQLIHYPTISREKHVLAKAIKKLRKG